MKRWKRWWTVVFYAMAMAWVESAVAYYLRTMMDHIDPYHPYPLHLVKGISHAELVREVATLVMLFMVGWLSAANWRSRLAYSLIAFGVWDIFYYIFLKVMCGWPHSVFNWDLLFLIPLPWWGPVLAPCCIAMLMILGGTLVTQFSRSGVRLWPGVLTWIICFGGAAVALYVFMADAIRVAPQGGEAVRNVLPKSFHWPLFLGALSLMAAPVLELAHKVLKFKSIAWRNAEVIERKGPLGVSIN
jgi:hypothetical protein